MINVKVYRRLPHVTEDSMSILIEGNDSVAEFRKLIQQGANLNPHLSPEMKTLADLVTTGTQQQPYES